MPPPYPPGGGTLHMQRAGASVQQQPELKGLAGWLAGLPGRKAVAGMQHILTHWSLAAGTLTC